MSTNSAQYINFGSAWCSNKMHQPGSQMVGNVIWDADKIVVVR